jgi:hypothetical protein
MLTLLVALALVVVLGLIVVRQRNLGFLMSLGSLLAGVLLLIWMQNQGLLPGTQGPLSDRRPQTIMDGPREPAPKP